MFLDPWRFSTILYIQIEPIKILLLLLLLGLTLITVLPLAVQLFLLSDFCHYHRSHRIKCLNNDTQSITPTPLSRTSVLVMLYNELTLNDNSSICSSDLAPLILQRQSWYNDELLKKRKSRHYLNIYE